MVRWLVSVVTELEDRFESGEVGFAYEADKNVHQGCGAKKNLSLGVKKAKKVCRCFGNVYLYVTILDLYQIHTQWNVYWRFSSYNLIPFPKNFEECS